MVYSYNDILTFELVATVVLKEQATRRKKGKYDQEEVTNHFAENDKIRRNKENNNKEEIKGNTTNNTKSLLDSLIKSSGDTNKTVIDVIITKDDCVVDENKESPKDSAINISLSLLSSTSILKKRSV
ncbi:hypothetical protein RhiirB3_432486 [Rhizophagus irregularis]|nr:hypothetical protein RhiirB3_432486 [Rhizophagus irregularis]